MLTLFAAALLGGVGPRLEPNGGGVAQVAVLLGHADSSVRLAHVRHIQKYAYPHSRRLTLFDGKARERMWSFRNGSVGETLDAPSPYETLYAVVDAFPFVWPASDVPHLVELGPEHDPTTVELKTLSARPRVLEADGVLTAEECNAIIEAARPDLKESVVVVQGKSQPGSAAAQPGAAEGAVSPRTSATAWLKRPSDEAEGRGALLLSAQAKLARLAGVEFAGAENMQVLRYGVGDHYHYHVDNGGSPSIESRALTALVYLNDDFEGGKTSFPMAGRDELDMKVARNVYAVRREYADCTTSHGLAVAPRRGSVVLFYSLQPNSMLKDRWAWHGSCDVSRGEKWAANYWFRVDRLDKTAAYPLDSQQHRQDCPGWALSGQCEENAAFMLENCAASCADAAHPEDGGPRKLEALEISGEAAEAQRVAREHAARRLQNAIDGTMHDDPHRKGQGPHWPSGNPQKTSFEERKEEL